MGQYKPTWQQAVEIVRRRCGRRPAVETVGLAQAGGRVLARALRAGTPFPESRLAGMDGVAVMNGVAATQVQTGQTLGADVQCVLMDELGVALGSSVGELPLNSHMSEIGAEYRQGELVASVGQQVSPGLMSQAALLGLTTLSVFVPPLLGVVVVGQVPVPGQGASGSRYGCRAPGP